MVWERWFRHDLTIILGRDTPWPSLGKDNQPWQFNVSVLHHLNWKQSWLNSSNFNASMNHMIFLWQIVFKQVLWNSSNLNYWSYHYRMVERMIEFLSSSAKLPCELLRWAIWHCLHICDNVVATEMQVRINFLISMKADLRQTPISSCSLSFCIVLVCVGFLEKQISELNSQLLMNLLFPATSELYFI